MSSTKGIQQTNWYNLMAKLYNDAGGWKIGSDVYKVEMIQYDSRGSVTTAKDLLSKAVLQDGCKYIIGSSITGSPDVDATITEPNKVIVIAEDFTYQSSDPKYKYYYSIIDYFQSANGYLILKGAVDEGAKSYVGVRPDTMLGHNVDPVQNAIWKMADPNIDYKETLWVSTNTIDYGPIATKIMSLNPDVADLGLLGTIPNSIPQVYRALSDAGYKGIVLPGQMTQDILDSLVTTVGKDILEGGIVYTSDCYTWQQDTRMRELMETYVKTYGKWENDATDSMTEWLTLEAAINATQSIDVDVVNNYLGNSPAPVQVLNGIEGYYARPDLGNYRTCCGDFSGRLGIIKDGKLEASTWTTLKDNYLFTIRRNNQIDVYKAYWEKYGYPVWPADQKGVENIKYSDLGISGQD